VDGVSESLNIDPDKLARVAGQFIAPNGQSGLPLGSTAELFS
jgi:hypothetical protein